MEFDLWGGSLQYTPLVQLLNQPWNEIKNCPGLGGDMSYHTQPISPADSFDFTCELERVYFLGLGRPKQNSTTGSHKHVGFRPIETKNRNFLRF